DEAGAKALDGLAHDARLALAPVEVEEEVVGGVADLALDDALGVDVDDGRHGLGDRDDGGLRGRVGFSTQREGKGEGEAEGEVEIASLYDMPAEKLLGMLKERGLTPVSEHFQYDRLTKDIAGAVAEAKTFGLKYAACPWIPHEGEFDEAECRKAATDFNAAGA